MGEGMRVALELQPCCGNRSGIGTYTYELAKRMRDTDDMEFCGNLFNFMGRNDNSAALKGIKMPINVSRVFPYGVYRRLWNVLPISYQSMFPQKVDLSIFFNFIVPPRVGGKVAATVYDMTYLRYPETMNRKNLRRIEDGIHYSVDRSDCIITISEFSKREIVELLGVPDDKVSVVYCAPVFSTECADFKDTAKRFGIHSPYILCVGTIEPRKNLVRLLRAFSTLGSRVGIPHQLVLAGGNGWENEEIYQTAREIPCSDDVIFTGYLSDAEKNTLYKNASAFVFPSLYEGFGIPPLEAMAHGCPVVCADAASLPEVVGDAAQLVDPLDEDSIATGILRVLSDKEYAAELIQRGYQQIQKFTWDASAQKLTEVCRAVLGEK